ncbi:MAG: hypothetical protein GY769_18940 [bacterium]|nr:hypothetical protein [bacterium]
MRPTKPRKSRVLLAALGLTVALGGCGTSDIIDIVFGGLTVDTITTGTNLDPNDYSLRVTGPSLNVEQIIGLNDQVTFSVTPGSYSARLADVAGNCTVDINPFNVIVTTGFTSRVTFNIVCS